MGAITCWSVLWLKTPENAEEAQPAVLVEMVRGLDYEAALNWQADEGTPGQIYFVTRMGVAYRVGPREEGKAPAICLATREETGRLLSADDADGR